MLVRIASVLARSRAVPPVRIAAPVVPLRTLATARTETVDYPKPKRRTRRKSADNATETPSKRTSGEPVRRTRRKRDPNAVQNITKRITRPRGTPLSDADPLFKNPELAEAAPHPFSHYHLPHPLQWPLTFSFSRGKNARYRYFVANHETAQNIVDKISLDRADGRKVTVIEAYPGPGTLTRLFMRHPNVEKVIALEGSEMFANWLDMLREDPAMADVKDKLSVLRSSGYEWSTYEQLVDGGYLDHLRGLSLIHI